MRGAFDANLASAQLMAARNSSGGTPLRCARSRAVSNDLSASWTSPRNGPPTPRSRCGSVCQTSAVRRSATRLALARHSSATSSWATEACASVSRAHRFSSLHGVQSKPATARCSSSVRTCSMRAPALSTHQQDHRNLTPHGRLAARAVTPANPWQPLALRS